MQKPNCKEEGKQEGKPNSIYRRQREGKYVQKKRKRKTKKMPRIIKVYVNRKGNVRKVLGFISIATSRLNTLFHNFWKP